MIKHSESKKPQHGKDCNCTFREIRYFSSCEEAESNRNKDMNCPDCNSVMVRRKSRHGIFWGCSRFPDCNGTRDVNGMSRSERYKEEIENEPR